MAKISRISTASLLAALVSVGCSPPVVSEAKPEPGSGAPGVEAELPSAGRSRAAAPSFVRLARFEGYGNPRSGELWMRAVPLVEGIQGIESGPSGVGVSAQALAGRAPGYCEAAYEADGVANSNPNGTLEFYNQHDASGSPADAPSFSATTCYGRLDPSLQTPLVNTLFSTQGVGCALQHVGNFTGTDYNRVLLDIDVFNGNQASHSPYGPPLTSGAVVTPHGRNAPYQDLGLWDYGPMPSGSQGQMSGPHLKDMWVFFKNGDQTDFTWSGYIVGEVFENCGDGDDDDCDGVDDNGCGTFADDAPCYADQDCASGYCAGAVVVSGQGEGGGELGDDTAGQCAPVPLRLDAGYRTTCWIVDGGSIECWGDSASALFTQAPSASDFTDLSLGLYDGCALKKNGSLQCWGATSAIQSAVPSEADFRQVSVGGSHACALRATGAVTCWGGDVHGEVGDAPTSTDFVALASGDRHSCGLKHSGAIACWGDNAQGQTAAPGNTVFVDVQAGYEHNCARAANNDIHCWGSDAASQVTGYTSGKFTALALGHVQSCGVHDDGTLECWGNNSYGQHSVPSGSDFVAITSGHYHLCAVRSNDSVVCWGDNSVQQTLVPAPPPTPALPTVSSGWFFGCAILSDTGKVKCWGDGGGSTQALAGYATQPIGVNAPYMNLGSARAVQVASGGAHSCAVFEDGAVRCWGNNDDGQARGVSTGGNVLATPAQAVPTPLDVGDTAVKVVTGAYHTCVLRTDAQLVCFGKNSSGALGMNSVAAVLPLNGSTPVPLGGPIADVCAGDAHTCALLQDGTVRCWGGNASGQLGLGNTIAIGDNEAVLSVGPVPVLSAAEVTAGRAVTQIACGSRSTCAVLDDGKLRCWGDNVNGTLGYGSTTNLGDNEAINALGYVNVGVGEKVAQVTVGDDVTCARLESGGTKCWGWTQRQVGTSCLGHPAGCSSAVTLPPATVVDFGGGRVAVELGYRSRSGTLCARLDDDGVKCWHVNGPSSIACGTNLSSATIDFAVGAYTLVAGVKIADLVLGQPGPGLPATSTTATGMNAPNGVAIDPVSGKVFVGDNSNRRVLRFASVESLSHGAAAEGVLGQPGFVSNGFATTATGMASAAGVAVDAAGRLWVADSGNGRVLRFDNAANKAIGAAADAVLGQPTFTMTGSSTAATGMNSPTGVAVDTSGRLWVADTSNHRVLRFDDAASKANGAAADGVLGQVGFGLSASGSGPTGMNMPSGVHVDGLDRVWVADMINHRVLRFDSAHTKANGASADGVLGQADLFTNSSGLNAIRMSAPRAVTSDWAGSLYVADGNNRRVLVFGAGSLFSNGPSAIDVFGAPNFASTATGHSLEELNYPVGLAIDAANRLWIADVSNHRVTMYVQ